MILRGTDFGRVTGASGVQGFHGERYPWHRYLGPFKPNFDGMTFVAKTTTFPKRKGNMALKKDGITPAKLFPDCVWCPPLAWLRGHALNSVGLSGKGAEALFEDGQWQQRTEPFMLSFMSVADTKEERLQELRAYVRLVQSWRNNFRAPFALQINFSCPNVGLSTTHLLKEVDEALEIASVLNVPLIPKLSITAGVSIVTKLKNNPNCDALCVTNTIPIGSFPDRINWKRLVGSADPQQSPLVARGYSPGGLSGAPLLPLLNEWVEQAKGVAPQLLINAGGGILCKEDALGLIRRGADSVALGSVAFLRPWRVQGIIRAVHRHFDLASRIVEFPSTSERRVSEPTERSV